MHAFGIYPLHCYNVYTYTHKATKEIKIITIINKVIFIVTKVLYLYLYRLQP